MPRTNGRVRVVPESWLAAYHAEMDPWFKRADAALAATRRLLGSTDDGNCPGCGDFGAHADGCQMMHWAGKS